MVDAVPGINDHQAAQTGTEPDRGGMTAFRNDSKTLQVLSGRVQHPPNLSRTHHACDGSTEERGQSMCRRSSGPGPAYSELHRWRLARAARLGLFREDNEAAYASPRWRTYLEKGSAGRPFGLGRSPGNSNG